MSIRTDGPWLCVAVLLSLVGATAEAATFQLLDMLPSSTGNGSWSTAVSPDGQYLSGYVPGDSSSNPITAVRWGPNGEVLGFGFTNSIATAISADGQRIAGLGSFGETLKSFWLDIPTHTLTTGFFGDNITPYPRETVGGMSADGNVVVGSNNALPMLWSTSQGAFVLPTAGSRGTALAISGDGSVVVGRVGDYLWGGQSDASQVARWINGTLDYFAPLTGTANAVSTSGTWIAGQASGGGFNQAFLWSSEGGVEWLGDLAGGEQYSAATGVSADGGRVVGSSRGDPYSILLNRAFIWDRQAGMQDMAAFLTKSGADLGGCFLQNATAISADGRWVSGSALCPSSDPMGTLRAFVADLEGAGVVPEPNSALLFATALLGLLKMRGRKRSDPSG